MISAMNDPVARLLGAWSVELTPASAALRICVSLVLAAIIGCERSSKRHSAGLRTFILVSLASTIAMLADLNVASRFPVISAATVISAAMISGNSILFTAKSQIRGLTTSAALWMSALIGMCAGAGLYTLTLISFAALIISISFFPSFEKYLKDRSNHFEVHLELKNRTDLTEFVTTVRKLGLRIDDIEANPAYVNSGLSVYSVSLTVISADLKKYKSHAEIVEALGTLEYVSYLEEMN